MVLLPPSVKIFICSETVDMRKGINSLQYYVQEKWKMDPFTGHMFIFMGKRRNSVKILIWDRGGFVLYYKRLSQGTFKLPKMENLVDGVMVIDSTELAMLLDGINYPLVNRPKKWVPKKR